MKDFGGSVWAGGMQIPVRDEVSSEDAAQYLINPVTGAYHRMP